MNFKREDRTLYNGDIVKPIIPYAEFSDDLTEKAMDDIINALNNGHDMLMIYKQYRGNINLLGLVEMLDRMEECFRAYDKKQFEINRGL